MKYLFLACLLLAACAPLPAGTTYSYPVYQPDFAAQAMYPPHQISCRSFFDGRQIVCN